MITLLASCFRERERHKEEERVKNNKEKIMKGYLIEVVNFLKKKKKKKKWSGKKISL